MKITTSPWGMDSQGQSVSRFETASPSGITAVWTDWGASLISLKVPSKNHGIQEVLLTFDTLDQLVRRGRFFGAVVGRWANRIALGKFTLNGIPHQLTINNAPHHLHGGRSSFCQRLWRAEPFEKSDRAGVIFRLRDPAGSEGYPGNLDVEAEYWLTDTGELGWELRATGDELTIVNLVNHAYWNLAGPASESVLEHKVTMESRFYYPGDETNLPKQTLELVSGTPFDFRSPKTLGQDFFATGNGYDHCYILEAPPGDDLIKAATLEDPSTGRKMEVFTTSPCVQLYTGNFLGGDEGAGGRRHVKYSGVCLETQLVPDAPNRLNLPPGHPSPLLRPGQLWRYRTLHRFTW